MDLNLTRIDFARIGTTNKGCMKIIPVEDNERKKSKFLDKIVCGSHNGILFCLGRKDGETQTIFKTMPGPKVVCLRLGGALGTVQNKIFIASENRVRAFSKKGKQFLAFDANMSEPISSMYIYGVEMFLCGERNFNHFHDCVDANAYLCADVINDVLCLPVVEGSWIGRGLAAVVACNDKTIKVIEGSELSYEVHLSDIPNVLHLFMNDGGFSKQRVLYGTKNGHLGLVDLPPQTGTLMWEIETKSTSAITCIHCYPISGGLSPDIVIGKEDGLIEIYTVNDADQATFCKSYHCDECVVSVQCGRVSSPNFDEIIVCTYTGSVFSLTTEPILKEAISVTSLSPQVEVKVQQLRDEVEELERKVGEERQRYHELTLKEGPVLSTMPKFTIRDHYRIDKELVCYSLGIELNVPIDFILLQSEVAVELIDVENNSAVVSITSPKATLKNALLATYRCQASTTRIEIRIRSAEGQYGFLRAYVCPKIHPKICQVRNYEIKPLSLHQRVHDFDSSRPLNSLRITGNFSVSEAHQWLKLLVSEIPDRTPAQDTVTFNFSSIFAGTEMQVTYSRGSAFFRSDNISTIAIIRDVLSKEVTKRQVKVDIQHELNDKSVLHVLHLLHPKLDYYANLTKKFEISRALKELSENDEDLNYLTGDLKQLLESFDELHKEIVTYSTQFDRLSDFIVDLYINCERMAGRCGKSKVNELLRTVTNYDANKLLEFFTTNN